MNHIKTKPNFYLGIAIAMTAGSILQIIVAIRYLGRHPDDIAGKIIFIAVAVLFLLLTAGSFIQWRNAKKVQSG